MKEIILLYITLSYPHMFKLNRSLIKNVKKGIFSYVYYNKWRKKYKDFIKTLQTEYEP